jgi:SWIM zinc finger
VIVPMQYAGRSGIVNGLRQSHVAFATNTLREATFLRGTVKNPLLFRDSLASMYHVVVSDYKYRPRDRLAFFAWLEEQDRKFLASLAMRSQNARVRLEELDERLGKLDAARNERLKPFHAARMEYFNYVYENQYELQLLFDPVITVHPDEVSFEAFSRDESTYARLAAKYDLFDKVNEQECGTTNIDFSTKLHTELERMRSYRTTRFDIDPGGFTATTDGSVMREKKIDLPDSWVMGFHQVHSTMTLGLTKFSMAPVDLFNICRYLRRRRARTSPRALRYELTPGQRVKAILEPWDHVIELSGSEPFAGPKPLKIRTWGRDRLRVLARLLPVCHRVDVYLAGQGLPSIYVLDLGPVLFTLGLSGWTDNDWTGGVAKFDLLSRRLTATAAELTTTYEALKKSRLATEPQVARSTGLSAEKARAALSYLCQVGRAMYDLGGGVYRHRDLFHGPFSAAEAAAAVRKAEVPTSPQEKSARDIFEQGGVRIIARRPVSGGYKLSGSARGGFDPARVRPLLHVDNEGRIVEAECTCAFFKKSGLAKGPCEHILALRLAHMSRLEEEQG